MNFIKADNVCLQKLQYELQIVYDLFDISSYNNFFTKDSCIIFKQHVLIVDESMSELTNYHTC